MHIVGRLLIQWINCEQSKDTQKHSWLTALLVGTASGKRDVRRDVDDLEDRDFNTNNAFIRRALWIFWTSINDFEEHLLFCAYFLWVSLPRMLLLLIVTLPPPPTTPAVHIEHSEKFNIDCWWSSALNPIEKCRWLESLAHAVQYGVSPIGFNWIFWLGKVWKNFFLLFESKISTSFGFIFHFKVEINLFGSLRSV